MQTGGGAEVSGGTFIARQIKTGVKTAGDVTITDASYTLGDASQENVIHGDLTAIGAASSGKIGSLTVDGVLTVNGGYLEGEKLDAASGSLKNKSHVHIDELVLSGSELALDIEAGSVLTAGTINGSYGDELIKNGSLVILGHPSRPLAWSELRDVDLEKGDLEADIHYARLKTGKISGKGQGENADDIRAHQLDAANINIANANLFLTGLGDYASLVRENLIIAQNGDTRLGDIEVKGKADISEGSVRGRQLKTGGDASFADTNLILAGSGDLASSIGGALTLNNSASQLGDISVSGDLTATGGSVEAGTLKGGANVVMNGANLNLNGLKADPSHIAGNLQLNANKDSSLWHLDVDGSISGDGGVISAHVINVGKDVFLSGASFSLRTLEGQSSTVKGNLTLSDNKGASLGAITIDGVLNVAGSTLAAGSFKTGSSALFDGVG